MDDIWLFDQERNTVVADALLIQEFLAERGLSVNDKKSAILEGYGEDHSTTDRNELKVHLLKRRRETLAGGSLYGDDGSKRDTPTNELLELSAQEREYLISLLNGERIHEEDAELVLSVMKEHSGDVLEHLPLLLSEFPSLAKRIYQFCRDVPDKSEVTAALLARLANEKHVTEYQLFWLAMMAEDYLMSTPRIGELIHELYKSEHATDITRAKILEISELRFDLADLRSEQLRSNRSDWLTWAAAVGSSAHPKGQRNQILKYFRKASDMNQLIGSFVESHL